MGNLTLNGATSGQITISPPAVAGTNTLTLPAATGTVALTANPTFTGTVTATTITSPAATNLTIQSAGTTAMTIDTSQNVGIGTSSPKTKLQSTAATDLNAPSLGSATSAPFYVTNSTPSYGLLIGTNNSDGHVWLQAQRTDGTATAYNITLNEAGGNVGIGLSSPTVPLDVYNASTTQGLFHTAAYGIAIGANATFGGYVGSPYGNTVFISANTERMRIDSSGNLLVGMTSGGGSRFNLTTNSGQSAFTVVDGNSGGLSWGFGPRVGTGTTTDFGFYNNSGSVFLGRFTSSGVWYQGNNSSTWSITSDKRIKKNISPVVDGLSVIAKLNPVEFDYIKNDKHDVGFIAQDYQSVLPSQVFEGNDGMLSLQQNLIPYLVAAIQELKAEFDAYKASHP